MPIFYRLKVSLLQPHHPINALHRLIEINGNLDFYTLKQAITHHFDFESDQDWQFIIARQKLDDFGKLKMSKEFVPSTQVPHNPSLIFHDAKHSFATLELALKDCIYLWLMTSNVGDTELVFRIRLERIFHAEDAPNTRLIKRQGEMPIKPKHNDTDFEMSLISALMLIATGGDGTPVRWQELLEHGVAHELIKRNLIKPCISPTHLVKMTVYGESELVRVLGDMGILK